MTGTTFDKYQILESLGKGGFGEVYKCQNTETSEYFAMKVCTKTEPEHIKRFGREVRLMESVDHPNVLKIADSNLDNAPPYFVMPLAKASLETYIPRLKENHEFALKVFLQACEGIKAIHISEKCHRDIKPENVLISQKDDVLISDLGLGKFETRDSSILTSSNVFMGTEGYIPPEYKTKGGTKNADKRGDVYQLGKMLYKILTGEDPILIDTKILPSSLVYIISKATKDQPSERFQSVSELMDAIDNYQASLIVDSNPVKGFEINLNTSKTLLKEGKYDSDVIKEIIKILYASKDNQVQFFEFFDKIPLELIRKIISDFTPEFNQIFSEYSSNIIDYITNNHVGFEYVEVIAKLMKVVYNTSQDLDVKRDALKINLISSVFYNRFYAMELFDELLLSIKNDDDAKHMAPMLIEEQKWFGDRIEDLPYKNLHSEFQSVVDFIKKEKESDSEKLSFDDL